MKRRKKTNIRSKADRLRLTVKRSNKNLFLQLIDDNDGVTKISGSTLKYKSGANIEAAQKLGADFAKNALEQNFKSIVFDRGNYVFKGRIKALVDAIKDAGVKI